MEVDFGQAEQEVETLTRGRKRKLEHLLEELNLENITSKKIKLDGEGKQDIHHFNSKLPGHKHF